MLDYLLETLVCKLDMNWSRKKLMKYTFQHQPMMQCAVNQSRESLCRLNKFVFPLGWLFC